MAWHQKAKKVEAPVVAPLSLQERITVFKKELEAFINNRAEALTRGTGLPLQVVLQTLGGGSHCICSVALRVVADLEKERELEKRQA
jgi:hypothetical protein